MAKIIKQGECLQDESTSGQGLKMHYTLTDDGTLTISGQGVVGCDEWSDDDLDHDAEMGYGWSDRFSHHSQFNGLDISRIVIEEGITGLAAESFVLLPVKKVVLPEGLSHVGCDVFAECSDLEEIILPSTLAGIGDRMFDQCESLRKIVIPEGVESIGKEAFSGCTSVESISLPSTLTSIGENAFFDCPNLETIESASPHFILRNGCLCSDAGEVVLGVNQPEVIIPENITAIRNNAFNGFYKVMSVTLPEEIKDLSGAFSHTGLQEVIVPKTVRKGKSAFSCCHALKKVIFCSDGEDIDMKYAFENCDSLKELVIADGVKVLSESMFAYCTSLESVYVPDSVNKIDVWAFRGCRNLKEIRLPEDISIYPSVLQDCPCLSSIDPGKFVKEEEKTDDDDELPF